MSRAKSFQQPGACMVLVVQPAGVSSRKFIDHLKSTLKAYGKVVSIQDHPIGFAIVTMASSVQAESVVSAAARGGESLGGYRIFAHKPLLNSDYLANTLRRDEEVAYKAAGIMPWAIRNVGGVPKACVLVGSEIRDETYSLVLNFIAGKREKCDGQAANAAAREFWEETGSRVPLEGMQAWAALLTSITSNALPADPVLPPAVTGAGEEDTTVTSIIDGVAGMSLAGRRDMRSSRSSPLFDGQYSHAVPDGTAAATMWLFEAKMALFIVPYGSLVDACGGLDIVALHADKDAKEHTVVPDVMESLHWIPIESLTDPSTPTVVDEAGAELAPGKFLQYARRWKLLQSHLRALAHLPPLPREADRVLASTGSASGASVTMATLSTAVERTSELGSRELQGTDGAGAHDSAHSGDTRQAGERATEAAASDTRGERPGATTVPSEGNTSASTAAVCAATVDGSSSAAAVTKRPTRLVPTRAGREVASRAKPEPVG